MTLKLIAFLVVFQLPFLLNAQKGIKKEVDRYHSLSLTLGQNIYNSSFNEFKPYTIGLQIPNINQNINLRFNYRGVISYSQIIPQNFHISDTINCRLNGFNYAMDLFAYSFFKKSKIVTLKCGVGFTSGLLMVKGHNFIQLNPFFSPQLAFYNGYTIGKRIIVGAGIAFSYDLSNPAWKKISGDKQINIKAFNQSGLRANLSLGFVW